MNKKFGKMLLLVAAASFIAQGAFAADAKKKTASKPAAKSAVAAPAAKPAAAAKAVNSYARNYGMAGCGLGSQLMGKDGNQVFAATTNGTGVQTIGITFGTSNCEDSETAKMAQRMDIFVTANQVALASDIAKGGGETLSSLGVMMNCGSSSAALSSTLQGNFGRIFPSNELRVMDITDSIITVIRSDANLAQACNVSI